MHVLCMYLCAWAHAEKILKTPTSTNILIKFHILEVQTAKAAKQPIAMSKKQPTMNHHCS